MTTREIIERKIYLKKQIVFLVCEEAKREIKALEKLLEREEEKQ